MSKKKKLFVIFIVLVFNVNVFATYLKGNVVDSSGKAIGFATIKLQNTSLIASTNRAGRFKIKSNPKLLSQYITASKNGYLIGGAKFNGFEKEYKIILTSLPNHDFKDYKFTPSLLESITNESKSKKEKVCQDCHNSIVKEWQKDKHSSSVNNKNFLSIFENIFKKDFPSSDGNCLRCHMPITALKNTDEADLSKLTKIEKEGISCDFCHKIKNVQISNNNLIGIQNMEFLRPKDDVELLFGPMHDVYPRFDAYASVYEQSRYCASCHNAKFWDVLVYSEYEEWKNSVYPKQGKSCQSCHMAQAKKSGFLADKIKGGYLRDAKEIHSHNMSISKEFIKNALDVKIEKKIKDKKLYLDVYITNSGAGHSIPTGSPFRAMVLSVNVVDEELKSLKQESKYILPKWSVIQGDGKIFAKIFRPVVSYGKSKQRFKLSYPEFFWRPIHLESDNRIKAKETDKTEFIFDLKNSKDINIEIKLSYINFIDSKILNKDLLYKNLKIYRKKIKIGVVR